MNKKEALNQIDNALLIMEYDRGYPSKRFLRKLRGFIDSLPEENVKMDKTDKFHSQEIQYYCENCDRNVCDMGPYETDKGDYVCQECMENALERTERNQER